MTKRPTRRHPHALRRSIGIFACFLVALTWGVWTAETTQHLGPHVADYEVTSRGEARIDLGPLGTIAIDSPAPFGLGLDIVVKEIPAELSAITNGESSAIDTVIADLQEYVHVFTGMDSTVRAVTKGLIFDIVMRTLAAFAFFMTSLWLLWKMLGPVRRREMVNWVQAHQSQVIAGGLTVALISMSAGSTAIPKREPDGLTSSALAGTALEDARFTGRLGTAIVTLTEEISQQLEDNADYYSRIENNLIRAWQQRWLSDDAPGHGGIGATAPHGSENIVTVLVVSDLHCNVSMTPVFKTAAHLSQSQLILNLGDTTMSGTALERYCIDSFAEGIPDGVTMVVSDGNHDSSETVAQERDAGMVPLVGDVVEFNGITILGDVDPYASRAGSGTVLAGEETLDEMAARLRDTACEEDGGIDLLMVHTPRTAEVPLESGCVSLAMSGHLHRRVGPAIVGEGVHYVSASTAGAASGQPTVGPLGQTAEMTVLRFDTLTRTWLDFQVIAVHPDESVEVGARVGMPAVPRSE